MENIIPFLLSPRVVGEESGLDVYLVIISVQRRSKTMRKSEIPIWNIERKKRREPKMNSWEESTLKWGIKKEAL